MSKKAKAKTGITRNFFTAEQFTRAATYPLALVRLIGEISDALQREAERGDGSLYGKIYISTLGRQRSLLERALEHVSARDSGKPYYWFDTPDIKTCFGDKDDPREQDQWSIPFRVMVP